MDSIYKIRNLNKSFSDKTIISNVDLDINKGDMISISGESGSGKSTFLNIIGFLDKPTSGNINLFGKDMTRASKSHINKLLREKIAYLFQNYALIENEGCHQPGYRKSGHAAIGRNHQCIMRKCPQGRCTRLPAHSRYT